MSNIEKKVYRSEYQDDLLPYGSLLNLVQCTSEECGKWMKIAFPKRTV